MKLRPQPYVLLLSGSHPLAGAAHIMPEQLAPYTEVVHADYDMPIYPYSDYRYSGGRTADRRKNVIFIYDRGTLWRCCPTCMAATSGPRPPPRR